MVSSTLDDKLEQPHLRDLARNPMQLAILLHLIHVQGPALPEKRTTLYEEYMNLFFNREAEKSPIVRDRRELLLSIHGVLAWVLQIQAEEGSGSGSITKDGLRRQVKDFLATEEYDPQLADTLLTGTVERVGALVSRLEGTFEFEVQPLREYFAARHLYKTAPHSPPGRPSRGTRPHRFDALARSFYWTNVTRFFCGFYDVGELGTLVDDLCHLGEEEGYCLINQPRRLAMMLLADHVFVQSPRMMKRLLGYVTAEPGFQRFIASATPLRGRGMALPETAGRSILFEACATKLRDDTDPARRLALRQVMAENADLNTLKATWRQRFRDNLVKSDPLREAMDFGIISRIDSSEIETFTEGDDNLRLRWLVQGGHYEAIVADRNLYDVARTAFFDGNEAFPNRRPFHGEPSTYLEVLSHLLGVRMLARLFSVQPDGAAVYTLLGQRYGFDPLDLLEQNRLGDGDSDPLASFTLFVVEHLNTAVTDWQTQLMPWSTLVNRGFDLAPGSLILTQIAAVATAVETDKSAGEWHQDGFASTKGLVDRLYFARQRAQDAAWWRLQLSETTADGAVLCLAILLSWAEPELLLEVQPTIGNMVDKLDVKEWSRLWSFLTYIGAAANSRRPKLRESWFDEVGVLSPRVALAMIDHVEDNSTRQSLSRRVFADYEGTDQLILRHVMDHELANSTELEVDWNFICHLSRLAKKSGLLGLFPMRVLQRWTVPDSVAANVLVDCENHCAQLVAICERAYGMDIAESAAKVATVAENDDWFAPHPT